VSQSDRRGVSGIGATCLKSVRSHRGSSIGVQHRRMDPCRSLSCVRPHAEPVADERHELMPYVHRAKRTGQAPHTTSIEIPGRSRRTPPQCRVPHKSRHDRSCSLRTSCARLAWPTRATPPSRMQSPCAMNPMNSGAVSSAPSASSVTAAKHLPSPAAGTRLRRNGPTKNWSFEQ